MGNLLPALFVEPRAVHYQRHLVFLRKHATDRILEQIVARTAEEEDAYHRAIELPTDQNASTDAIRWGKERMVVVAGCLDAMLGERS